MVTNLPENFDWVTHRNNCNAVNMLQKLNVQAIGNIEKRNAQLSASMAGFGLDPHGERGFTVFEKTGSRDVRAVDVSLAGETITFARRGGASFALTLKLDRDGVCRCRVEGEPELLDPWQVLMKALEPLFFPS